MNPLFDALQKGPKDIARFVTAYPEQRKVAFLTAKQMRLLQPAAQTVGERTRLLFVIDKLPENLVKEVADFAEFLQHKAER